MSNLSCSINIDQIAWRQLLALEDIEKDLPSLQRKLETPKRKPETIRWRGQYLRAIAGRIHGLMANGILVSPSPSMQAYMKKVSTTAFTTPIHPEEVKEASQVVRETIAHLRAVLSSRPKKQIFH